MSLMVFNPVVAPSPGTSRKPEIKLLKAEFGDGYSQIVRDGLNHIRRVFDLKWDVLTQGQADAIEGFLEGHGGADPFLYKHAHYDTHIQVTCDDWSREDQAAGLCSFRATLRQSFALVS